MNLSRIALALLSISFNFPVFSAPSLVQPPGTVVEEKFETRLESPKDIHFFIRWPKTAGAVKGMLCYCTYRDSPADLMKQMKDEAQDKGNPAADCLNFADEEGLILMTWTLGAGFWDKSVSADEMEKARAKFYDKLFDDVANVWEQSLRSLIRKYELPRNNYLICGHSRGAQWAHRVALRHPEYFKAVSITVNSSYDLPTKGGGQVWWHAATGELENGYEAGKRWYAACTAQGYQVIFRGDPNMGHNTSAQSQKMRWAFFRYALQNINLPHWQPQYVGDLVNQVVYPLNQAQMIPPGQRVYLPNEEMAKLYGELKKG